MKIAIFAVDLRIGGVEKSLVNFCNILSAGHEIDLYLMYKNGPLLGKINQKINVFEINELKKFVKIYWQTCQKNKSQPVADFLLIILHFILQKIKIFSAFGKKQINAPL